MRSMMDMDTIQIEVTNFCVNSCANCSRFCPHIKKPYYLPFNDFKIAVDSLIEYPKMTGIQGGEPLLHPEFEKMCKYLQEKIPKKQLGLWTTFPKGYEHYREIICETFYHVFLNDHSRDDIYHHPGLVAIEEIELDKNKMWNKIDHCWAQEGWSASINPRGAWFCEIAGSMSMFFEEGYGWKVEPGWWWRIPKDFKEQMERFCTRCGYSANIKRRSSIENIDDISPDNFRRLKSKSKNPNRFQIHNLEVVKEMEPLAAYKDLKYRNKIANKYGIFLIVNEYNFWTPYLIKSKGFYEPTKLLNLYKNYVEK